MSVVAGGWSNTVAQPLAFVGGGYNNTINSGSGLRGSNIGGGVSNSITGKYSSIAGGNFNEIIGDYCQIWGYGNALEGNYSMILGRDVAYLAADSTIYLKNRDIILDGAVKDPSGNSFLPFWTSGDTLYFEVGDSTWVIVRDSIFATP